MTLDVSQFPSPDLDQGIPLDLGRPVTGSPFVAVPFLAAVLRRRMRLVVTCALAGVALAAGVSVASPPPYTATTTILLVHGGQEATNQAMATELGLLKTTSVAQGALALLGERSSAQHLLTAYQGLQVSDNLLEVTAKATGGRRAVRRADAVARSFLDFRAQEFQRQSDLAIKSIRERQSLLTAELNDVNARIDSSASDQRNDAAVKLFGELLTRRTSLNDQTLVLLQQIDTQERDTRAIIEQSRVVDPASSNIRAARRTAAGNMAAGLVAGVALGAGFVVAHAVASDRVRRRDDIAAALGVSVGVSIGRLPRGRRAIRRRFKAHLAEPDPDIVRLERHLTKSLAPAGSSKPALLVLSVDTDGAAAAAVAAAAADLAKRRAHVLLVDLTVDHRLAGVLGAPTDRPSSLSLGADTPAVTVATASEGTASEPLLQQARAGADVILLLGRLDPGLGAVPLTEWATASVAMVTSGRSTGTALRSAAQLLRAAGIGFDSAVVVGADRDDDSVGLLDWAGTESSDGRSRAWSDS